jgi:hypothetical protein
VGPWRPVTTNEAEYVLNMDIVPRVGGTGRLWRVDSGTDQLIANVGPLEFGSRT